MSRQNPTHPGGVVRDNIDELRLSIAKAALALGVSRNQLNNVVSGKSNISAEMAVRLEMAIGGTADTWLRAQNNYDIAQARKIVGTLSKIVTRPEKAA